jgi:hypothetical protein
MGGTPTAGFPFSEWILGAIGMSKERLAFGNKWGAQCSRRVYTSLYKLGFSSDKDRINRHEYANRTSSHKSSPTENRTIAINPTPKSSFRKLPYPFAGFVSLTSLGCGCGGGG